MSRMKMINKNIFTALVLILMTAAAIFAQEQPNNNAATKNEDDFVTEKGFNSSVPCPRNPRFVSLRRWIIEVTSS